MSEACLHLQNRHDLDIPLVLFAAFTGAVRREALTESGVAAARAGVDAWHREIIRPLRGMRQRLKTGPAPAPNDVTSRLRSQVQKIEIEAELIELDELGALMLGREPVPASGSPAESAAAAIQTVIRAYSDTPIDDRDRTAIETIAGAAG